MEYLSDNEDDEAKLILLDDHRKDTKPTAFELHQPPQSPPPILSEIPYPYEESPAHPSSFMITFLIALTCGLLIVTFVFSFDDSDNTNPNPNPDNFPLSLSVKSIYVRSLNASSNDLHHVTAYLDVEISLHNTRYPHRLDFSVIASAFQSCDLLAKSKILEVRLGNSTDVKAEFKGMRLGVTDWIVDKRKGGSERNKVGISSFGMKVAIESPAMEERVEFRCGMVVVGFTTTKPAAGKLLLGPVGCWAVKADSPPCF